MTFEPGSRVRIPHRPDLPGHVRIELAMPTADGWQLFVEKPTGHFHKVLLTRDEAAACEILTEDGGGDSTAVLAGLWTAWMKAASAGARSAALASSPLKPYAHQMNAVCGAMLPQPSLRFLLADEPGTGKTIMAGMYVREMQRLGFVGRALVVAPAHLVKEWLFRALLHLVDPDVYPPVISNEEPAHAVKPGRVHFLRRMKEDLVDLDGVTGLFKGRSASNEAVPLNSREADFYAQALDLVDRFFPATAVPLGRMVYGKRAASSLYALAETLKRRRDGMGSAMPAAAALAADPDGDDPAKADEARVIVESSKAAKQERKEVDAMLARLQPLLDGPSLPVSKWDPLALTCLAPTGSSQAIASKRSCSLSTPTPPIGWSQP